MDTSITGLVHYIHPRFFAIQRRPYNLITLILTVSAVGATDFVPRYAAGCSHTSSSQTICPDSLIQSTINLLSTTLGNRLRQCSDLSRGRSTRPTTDVLPYASSVPWSQPDSDHLDPQSTSSTKSPVVVVRAFAFTRELTDCITRRAEKLLIGPAFSTFDGGPC